MNKERSGILSSMGFECSGINLKHKNKNGTGFKEIFKCWGIARFQEFLRIFVMFWYSNNGWNGYNFGSIFKGCISDSDKSKLLNRLPLDSFKFEKFCKDLITSNGCLELITSRGTRKGYFFNVGCRCDVCHFILKYKVSYSSKYSQFYYKLSTNGMHDINFKIGGSKLYYLSYDSK
jgi:hypothetical protein